MQDLSNHFLLFRSQLGWLAFAHFDGHDAERPDIDGILVSLCAAFDELGRHPGESAHHRLASLAAFKLARESKVAQLHCTTGVDENVVALDVPVNDVHLVEEVEATQHLPQDVLDDAF